MVTGAMFFVAWIASGTIQMQGVTEGSLGRDGDGATVYTACANLDQKKKEGLDAHLYEIGPGGGMLGAVCDWGCQQEIGVEEVTCETETHTQTETHVVPLWEKSVAEGSTTVRYTVIGGSASWGSILVSTSTP